MRNALTGTRGIIIGVAAAVLALTIVVCLALVADQGGSDASRANDQQSGLSIGTNGRPFVNIGGGLAIDPSTGKTGINVGSGLTVPLH